MLLVSRARLLARWLSVVCSLRRSSCRRAARAHLQACVAQTVASVLPHVLVQQCWARLASHPVPCGWQESEDARIARAGASMSTDAATAYARLFLDSIEPQALVEGGFGVATCACLFPWGLSHA